MAVRSYSLAEVANLFGIDQTMLHCHDSRRDWLVNDPEADVDMDHPDLRADSQEHETSFLCIGCRQWLRNAQVVLEHANDYDMCRRHSILSRSLRKDRADYSRLLPLWAPYAPSISNLFWLMQGAWDLFMVCPQCHMACKNALTLQSHLNMGCSPKHWRQLPVSLSPTCLRVLPFLAMNISRGAMTGFSQLGSMRLAISRRMVQIMYDLILTNYSFTRTSVQIAGKLRKTYPWKQLPSGMWRQIVSFLF